jgi:hypothetical protein
MIPDSPKRKLNTPLEETSVRFTVTSRHGKVFSSERLKADSGFKDGIATIYTVMVVANKSRIEPYFALGQPQQGTGDSGSERKSDNETLLWGNQSKVSDLMMW